jgi:hypothetical protein
MPLLEMRWDERILTRLGVSVKSDLYSNPSIFLTLR